MKKKSCASSWLFTKIVPRWTVNRTQKTASIYILEVGLMAIVITNKGLQGTCVQLSTS